MTHRQRRDPLDDGDDLLAGDEPEPPAEPEPEPSALDELDAPADDGAWIAEDEEPGTDMDEDLWDDIVEPPVVWPEDRASDDEIRPEEDRLMVEDEWVELEDEARLLPAGAALIGLREVVALPDHAGVELVAVMNTGLATSALHARYEVVDGLARLWIGEMGLSLPLEAEGTPLTVLLCGRRVELRVSLTGRDADEPLELGRDALEAGRFLVDVGRSFVHRVAGAVPWRM